jgi:hypothetical protein
LSISIAILSAPIPSELLRRTAGFSLPLSIQPVHQNLNGHCEALTANLYSLVESAKANGIDPYPYLVALFRALPLATTVDDYEALLPWNLTPSQP